MKIKEQTRKLAVDCSKNSFEVADKSWYGLNLIFEEYKMKKGGGDILSLVATTCKSWNKVLL